jgi:hypothetical protein
MHCAQQMALHVEEAENKAEGELILQEATPPKNPPGTQR